MIPSYTSSCSLSLSTSPVLSMFPSQSAPTPHLFHGFSNSASTPTFPSLTPPRARSPRYQYPIQSARALESTRPSNEQSVVNSDDDTRLFAEKRGNRDLAVSLAAAELATLTVVQAATLTLGTIVGEYDSGVVDVPPLKRWGKLVRAGKRYAARIRKGSR